jgi:hypothetical protein
MIDQTRNMLCSARKDLLYISKIAEKPWTTKVDFLHRTVYDFQKMQQLLNDGTPEHFRSERIFHLLNLARIKFKFYDPEPGNSSAVNVLSDSDTLRTSHDINTKSSVFSPARLLDLDYRHP